MENYLQILSYDLLVRSTLQAMVGTFRLPRKCEGLFPKSLELIGFGVSRVSLLRVFLARQ